MVYFMRFWAGLIGLVFVSLASVITIALAFISAAVLFACALIATPFFFFSANASGALERATQIVVSPLQFGGSTVAELWSQLWNIVSGNSSGTAADETVRGTAMIAMMVTFSGASLVGIGIAPLTTRWEILAYAVAGFALIAIWALIFISWSGNDGLVVRIGTGAILLAFSAVSLICITLAPLSENWRIATYTLSILGLAAIWTATIAIVWGDT
jgi:hypothetical protein